MQHIEREALAGVQRTRKQRSRRRVNGMAVGILFNRRTLFYVIILSFAIGLTLFNPVDILGAFSAEMQQKYHPNLATNAQLVYRYSLSGLLSHNRFHRLVLHDPP